MYLRECSHAGAAPIIFSLLSDLYPPSARVIVSTVVLISTGAGVLLGQALAGISGLEWRWPFVLVGVPSVLIATLMVLTTRDPKRGAADVALQAAYEEEGFQYNANLTWSKFFMLCRIRTNLFMVLQVRAGSVTMINRI
jgi:MFS family permease